MMNNQTSGSMFLGVAIFWDWQNCRATEEQIQCLVGFAYLKGNIILKKVYSDWNLDKNRKLQNKLFCEGFKASHVPSYKNKPNRTDEELIYDCEQEALEQPDIKTVILVSGDGDFKTLVRNLKIHGKNVIVVAQCEKNTSQVLRKVANEFYFLSQIEQQFRNLQFAA
ncbi:NYN domain-containing protein [Nodularia sp. UHCC 0506]|uniref:NYN domain-containing protein n=1 Tax=Nodularia sp. UHCC 0506 TaxID=3110243 RepID=UPI002B2105C4|nr:NYN domain-containing protein [Nodularia sp. UHCC 0506]MEA5512954.1 NYN domain-containing protein [Nodularia sp. UHCC 0506]